MKLVDFFALLFMIFNVSQFLMLMSNNFKFFNLLKKRHFFLEKATKRPRNINHCISKGNRTRRLLPLCGSKNNFGSRVNRSRLPIFADETQKGSFVCSLDLLKTRDYQNSFYCHKRVIIDEFYFPRDINNYLFS